MVDSPDGHYPALVPQHAFVSPWRRARADKHDWSAQAACRPSDSAIHRSRSRSRSLPDASCPHWGKRWKAHGCTAAGRAGVPLAARAPSRAAQEILIRPRAPIRCASLALSAWPPSLRPRRTWQNKVGGCGEVSGRLQRCTPGVGPSAMRRWHHRLHTKGGQSPIIGHPGWVYLPPRRDQGLLSQMGEDGTRVAEGRRWMMHHQREKAGRRQQGPRGRKQRHTPRVRETDTAHGALSLSRLPRQESFENHRIRD